MTAIFDNEKFNLFQIELDKITVEFLRYKQSHEILEDTLAIFNCFFTKTKEDVAQYCLILDDIQTNNKTHPNFTNILLATNLAECLSIYNEALLIYQSYQKNNNKEPIILENSLLSFMPNIKQYNFKI